MYRLPDWEERIIRYLEPLHATPFAWGQHDCCTFAAGAVEAMTGVDPMPEFRGHYSTKRGSVCALRRFGAGTLAKTLDTKFERVPVNLAHRGDLVMTSGGLGLLWVLHGSPIVIAVGSEGEREGLIRIARSAWIDPIAWRVAYAT
jgi:hypothetical protein